MKRTDLHVRLPEDLADALAAEAEHLGVSMNAAIIVALRQWQASKES